MLLLYILLIIGLFNVLFSNISIDFLLTNVSVNVGNVKIPLFFILLIIGLFNVLFSNICVVFSNTIVSSFKILGKYIYLLLDVFIILITGLFNVLFSNVCV